MTDDQQKTLAILCNAVRKLLQDKELAYADPAERAVVARLGNLLDGKFVGWTIDLE